MVKIFIKGGGKSAPAAARRINSSFRESAVRRAITTEFRNGSTIRQIQRSINNIGSNVPQRDILQYLRTNFSDRSFNRWVNIYGKNTNAAALTTGRLFERSPDGSVVRGFVRAIDMRTNIQVFHTVDIIVPRNTTLVKALELIRQRGLERLEDSLDVDITQTGFII
jgi:hypothetical protein